MFSCFSKKINHIVSITDIFKKIYHKSFFARYERSLVLGDTSSQSSCCWSDMS